MKAARISGMLAGGLKGQYSAPLRASGVLSLNALV